jgi:hypothetical protein
MNFYCRRVHSEFATLFVWWIGKIEKQGGEEVLILFLLQGLLREGKSISLLKFFVV